MKRFGSFPAAVWRSHARRRKIVEPIESDRNHESISMRTLLFLIAGVLLLASFLLLGKLFSASATDAPRVALISFVVVWLILAGLNMWIGVSRAGYSIADELPIFLLIFGVPAVAAALLKWRLL
jgi:hypothetical protein